MLYLPEHLPVQEPVGAVLHYSNPSLLWCSPSPGGTVQKGGHNRKSFAKAMVIKLTFSQTRPHPLISLRPPFSLWSQGAKDHVMDAAIIILRRKGWSLAKLPLCTFFRSSPHRVPDPSHYTVRLWEP